MTARIHCTALAALQLEDAGRACLTAAAALRSVSLNATDPKLARVSTAILSSANELANDIAGLRQRTRIAP